MKIAKSVTTLNQYWSLGKQMHDLYNEVSSRYHYVATVDDRAFVYPEMMIWLAAETDFRHVKFMSYRDTLIKRFNSESLNRISLDGYTLKVEIAKPKIQAADIDAEYYGFKVNFTCRYRGGMQALEKKLKELTVQRAARSQEPMLRTMGQFGWLENKVNARSLDSIFLKDNIKESIVNDLETFLNSREHFDKIGMPWHRGYLFYGSPGNGKTSLAMGLAHHCHRDLYLLSLSSIKSDENLLDRITAVEKDGILLIEDVDIFSRVVGRQQNEGPTLAGLLNALDGAATPDGLITIMSTNCRDSLDAALIRPGRVDMQIMVDAPDATQIANMFEYVYNEPLDVEPGVFGCMAEVTDIFKRNAYSPDTARLEIKAHE